jgi:hypothetical protein
MDVPAFSVLDFPDASGDLLQPHNMTITAKIKANNLNMTKQYSKKQTSLSPIFFAEAKGKHA